MLVVAALAVGLLQELLELRLRVAPREIAVRLRETGIAQGAHHGRAGEGLGEEQHLRVLLRHGGDHVLPEPHRLGVRVVDAEDGHTCVDPQVHDAFDLTLDALEVIVEVDRIDVAVLLRRVLGVGDRAVRLGAEPVRMLLHPRVVRRALQGEVERHFEVQFVGAAAERLEVIHRAEQRIDGVVAAKFAADAERRARVVRARVEGTVGALAVRHADREDRGQVHDVEALRLGALQSADGRVEVALHLLAVVVEVGALGTREELSIRR